MHILILDNELPRSDPAPQAVLSLDAPVGIAAAREGRVEAPINLQAAIMAFSALKQEGDPQLNEVEESKTMARWEA